MTPKSALFAKVLMNRFHKGSADALLQFLPENEAELVRRQEIGSGEVEPFFSFPLNQIHASWLLPIFEKVPKQAQSALCSLFPEVQVFRLQSLLKLKETARPPLPFIVPFLRKLLLKNFPEIGQILPLEYLPDTPLHSLSQQNSEFLLEIINFLGIHDLAEEIRQVVDTKILKKVYGCLDPTELNYLKFCMQLKEKFKAPALGLDKWSGDCTKLKATLQMRGLIRLGKALSGQHPDLIWHISHIFDMGRGQTFLKYYSKEAFPNITPALSQQVISLMEMLKKKSRS